MFGIGDTPIEMAGNSDRGRPILTNELSYVDRNKMASKKQYEKVIQLLTEAEAVNHDEGNDADWEDVEDDHDNDKDENGEEEDDNEQDVDDDNDEDDDDSDEKEEMIDAMM